MNLTTRTYTVQGMTCGHCELSVTEEVSDIAGVTDVAVDLPTGQVTVDGDGFTDADVQRAVAEAGYEVVS
jgi:copper chaperone CopZ